MSIGGIHNTRIATSSLPTPWFSLIWMAITMSSLFPFYTNCYRRLFTFSSDSHAMGILSLPPSPSQFSRPTAPVSSTVPSAATTTTTNDSHSHHNSSTSIKPDWGWLFREPLAHSSNGTFSPAKAIERMRAGETWILRYLREKEPQIGHQTSQTHASAEESVSAVIAPNQQKASMVVTVAPNSTHQSLLIADTMPPTLANPSPPRKRRLGAYIARADGESLRPRARVRLERRRSWPSMRLTRRHEAETDKAMSKHVLTLASNRARLVFDAADATVTTATMTPNAENVADLKSIFETGGCTHNT